MPTYTARLVERLLKNYLDIRATLEGNAQRLHDSYVVVPRKVTDRERPFGQTATGEPWPFMDTPHARSPVDGKTKARFFEDLHCAVIDIEDAFPRLADDDQQLIMDYLITQNKTLDEICAERHVSSKGSMSQRIFRAVQRLTYLMENK